MIWDVPRYPMQVCTFFLLIGVLAIVFYIWYRWPVVIFRYFVFLVFWLGFVFAFYSILAFRALAYMGEPPRVAFLTWLGNMVLFTGSISFLVTFAIIALRLRTNPNTNALLEAIVEADRRLNGPSKLVGDSSD